MSRAHHFKLFKQLILLVGLFVICLYNSANAAAPNFNNLSEGQINGVLKDFASSMYPTTVSGASSLGKLFGFELGVEVGAAESPNVDALTTEKVDKFPKAAFMGIVSVPFGLGAEVAILPVKVGDFEYNYYSVGARWTITDAFSFIPFFDLKLRAQVSNGEMKFKDQIAGVPTDVTFDHKSFAYNLTIGKKILFIEPYLGFGHISGKNSLTSSGTVSIFNVSVPVTAHQDVKLSDNYYYLGAQLHLFILNLGLEWAKVYDNKVITGKLSFGF